MKLALIRRHFSPTGGAELYLQRLLGALAECGHELHLFTESWPQAPAPVAVHPIRVSGGRARRAHNFALGVRSETERQPFDCVFSLDRTLKQDVYRAGDGVHRVWLNRRRQFAPWWKKPFVGAGPFHRTMLRLETGTFDPQNTGRIIANSEMVKGEILEHFRFPAEQIHVVRNGVDVARFQRGDRETTRARWGVAQDEFLVLFVGSGWERKGLSFLLKFMDQCRNPSAGLRVQTGSPEKIKLLVVGKESPPATFPRNVIFAGAMADVENAYAAADLFVFLPIYEPSANVVFEALAAGVPVVTSALNGASELIRDDVNGSVVADPSDLESVARAIGHWRTRPGRLAPIDPEQFGVDRHVRETLAILELASGEKGR